MQTRTSGYITAEKFAAMEARIVRQDAARAIRENAHNTERDRRANLRPEGAR